MDSKLSLALFLLISIWLCLGFCENGGGRGGSAACLQKLLPCEAFLKSPTPPASCCIPVTDLIVHDSNCLCHILNSAQLLKTFNITREDALKLPRACGAHLDISHCKSAASPSPSPPPPTAPSTPATSNSSVPGSPPTSYNAANRMPSVGISTFIAILVVSIIIGI